ncbi:hypothetical protein B0H18DRAFT_963337 [Fomitopsis serialis]|nr:hypothetical protein B0H18DRAFT_963337 [Neoantrodia serialis]
MPFTGLTTAKAFAKDVFINQERRLGDRKRSDTSGHECTPLSGPRDYLRAFSAEGRHKSQGNTNGQFAYNASFRLEIRLTRGLTGSHRADFTTTKTKRKRSNSDANSAVTPTAKKSISTLPLTNKFALLGTDTPGAAEEEDVEGAVVTTSANEAEQPARKKTKARHTKAQKKAAEAKRAQRAEKEEKAARKAARKLARQQQELDQDELEFFEQKEPTPSDSDEAVSNKDVSMDDENAEVEEEDDDLEEEKSVVSEQAVEEPADEQEAEEPADEQDNTRTVVFNTWDEDSDDDENLENNVDVDYVVLERKQAVVRPRKIIVQEAFVPPVAKLIYPLRDWKTNPIPPVPMYCRHEQMWKDEENKPEKGQLGVLCCIAGNRGLMGDGTARLDMIRNTVQDVLGLKRTLPVWALKNSAWCHVALDNQEQAASLLKANVVINLHNKGIFFFRAMRTKPYTKQVIQVMNVEAKYRGTLDDGIKEMLMVNNVEGVIRGTGRPSPAYKGGNLDHLVQFLIKFKTQRDATNFASLDKLRTGNTRDNRIFAVHHAPVCIICRGEDHVDVGCWWNVYEHTHAHLDVPLSFWDYAQKSKSKSTRAGPSDGTKKEKSLKGKARKPDEAKSKRVEKKGASGKGFGEHQPMV